MTGAMATLAVAMLLRFSALHMPTTSVGMAPTFSTGRYAEPSAALVGVIVGGEANSPETVENQEYEGAYRGCQKT